MKSISTDEFEELIYDEEETALILFHKRGCRACREVSGLLRKFEEPEEYGGKLLFADVDAEKDNSLFSRFGVKGVPQIGLFSGGTLIRILPGRQETEVYRQALGELLASGQ